MSQRVFIITGVSGSGKSSVGQALATRLAIPFYDGDSFHSEANRAKMENEIPLTDEDRSPWLQAINQFIRQTLPKDSLVFACSALTDRYRTMLVDQISPESIYWVHLQGNVETIAQRMKQREGHFMPPGLLPSQLATYEQPTSGQLIDIGQSIDEIVDAIISHSQLGPTPAQG